MSLRAAFRLTRGPLHVDVEMSAAAGEVLAIVGPNGAGKTTCLRVLAGLEAVDEGRVELDGRALDDAAAGVFVPAERRSTGYVFQEYRLFPHLSARDNVAFGLRARGAAAARAAAGAWLERVGVGHRANARPGALSGGEAQRVALARALAREPRVLLLDEPLAALDATTAVELRRNLGRHLAAFGGIAVLVTHDPVDAAVLADSVLVLEGGRVAQRGTLDEITARPRSRYVGDLAGVNLWRGSAMAGRVTLPGGATITAASEVEGDVFAMVLPRAVALYPRRPEGTPRNVWPGRVVGVERVGDRARVQVQGAVGIVAEVTASAVADLHLAGDEEIWVSVKATEVEVYPA